MSPDPGVVPDLPNGWVLTASSFNWTPDVIRAKHSAADIAVGIVDLIDVIELEAGQVWRSFPQPADDEVDTLARRLAAVGGRVSIVGGSIDEFVSPNERRDENARYAFLLPQLRAAHRVGAHGLRLPLGQAGRPQLERLQPTLE